MGYQNVVPLLNHWAIVQDFVPAVSLSEAIPEGGFECRPFLRLPLSVVKGLAAIHRAGVIHEGIHPGNLV